MGIKTPFKWLYNYAKSFDIYGKSFNFTYEGEDQYKTFLGGIISIIITSVILVYSVNLFIVMINRDDTSTNVNTVITSLGNDTEELQLGNSTFQFAISIDSENYSFLGDDSYFSINMIQFDENESGQTEESIPFSVWGDRFNFDFPRSNTSLYVSTNFLWPETYNLQLVGDNQASRYKYVELLFKKWENGTGIVWQDQATIDNLVNELDINVFIVNTYFDQDDYTNPIKTYIEDGLEYRGLNSYRSDAKYYFQENDIEMLDNYFSLLPSPTQKSFFRLANSNNLLSFSTSEIMHISFLKSNQKQTFVRSVFTFLDLLGVLGGIFGILSMFGGFFVSIFADKMLNYSILSSLYQVDTIKCQKDHWKDYKSSNQIQVSLHSQINRIQESKSAEVALNQEVYHYEGENNGISSRVKPIYTEANEYRASLAKQANDNITHRRLYNYKATDLCYNIFCCCKLRCF